MPYISVYYHYTCVKSEIAFFIKKYSKNLSWIDRKLSEVSPASLCFLSFGTSWKSSSTDLVNEFSRNAFD